MAIILEAGAVVMPDGNAGCRRVRTGALRQPGGLLEAVGTANLFLETPASGTANRGQPASQAGFGFIQQGYAEDLNVNAVAEISSLS